MEQVVAFTAAPHSHESCILALGVLVDALARAHDESIDAVLEGVGRLARNSRQITGAVEESAPKDSGIPFATNGVQYFPVRGDTAEELEQAFLQMRASTDAQLLAIGRLIGHAAKHWTCSTNIAAARLIALAEVCEVLR